MIPLGLETQDPNIKSVVLYQLSYEIIAIGNFRRSVRFVFGGANIGHIFCFTKIKSYFVAY